MYQVSDIIFPKHLEPGDRIAIVSPSSGVKPEYVDGAEAFIRSQGYVPVIGKHAKGPADGSYAAPLESRLEDFTQAWKDPTVRAVLCARGGYGAVHLLPHLKSWFLRDNAKWLIGYSDISALHAMLLNAGVASVHAPMAKHLTESAPDDASTVALMELLSRGLPLEYEFEPHPFNRTGEAAGRLVGGNLAVINDLGGTPYDMLATCGEEPLILFVEDIAEAIYAVERMMYRVRLSDHYGRIKGIMFGQFTEYKADRNHPDMETMLRDMLVRTGIDCPVCFNFPVGHVAGNYPMVEGSWAMLKITPSSVALSQWS